MASYLRSSKKGQILYESPDFGRSFKDSAHGQPRVPVNYFSIIFLSFHICTVHLAIIKVFLLPNDAKENCFKKEAKKKNYIKIAPADWSGSEQCSRHTPART
jgi:hypothetical protein